MTRRKPPPDPDAVRAFIEARKHNRFLSTATTLAEDLDREGLWPKADPLDVADFCNAPLHNRRWHEQDGRLWEGRSR